MIRRSVYYSVFSLLLAAPAIADEVALPDYYPAEYADMVEASKAEDGVFVYSNISVENWAQVLDAFKVRYPWIKVETLDLSSSTIHSRFEAESGSSARTADLLVSASNDRWIVYSGTDVLDNYVSPELGHLEPFANPVPGVYVMSTDPSLIVYNKLIIPEDQAPTGLIELAAAAKADPATYEGKVTSYDATRSSYGVALWWSIMEDMGESAWTALTDLAPSMKVETSAGLMLEKIAAGEYVVGYALGSTGVFPFLDGPGGELLGIEFPTDGSPMIFRGMGIPKNARSANSAKLLLDFILSHAGQTLLGKSGVTPYRDDVDESEVPYTFQSVAELIGGEDRIIQVAFRAKMVEEADAFVAKWGQIVLGGAQ